MVRMDRLLEAWRTDPRVDATVELCAMLIRAALKAGPNKLLPDDFVIGFANEARTRHPSNIDVSIAITDLYLSTGLINQALAVLDMAARAAPTDNRVKERLEKLGRRRRTQEFAAARTPDPETLDAPTTPLDPPTEPVNRGAPPPLPVNPNRKATVIGLSAAPPPLPAPRAEHRTKSTDSMRPPPDPSGIPDPETTRTESGVPAALQVLSEVARPKADDKPKATASNGADSAPTDNPRRRRTFLFGEMPRVGADVRGDGETHDTTDSPAPRMEPQPEPAKPATPKPTDVAAVRPRARTAPIPRTDDDAGPATKTKVDESPAARVAVERAAVGAPAKRTLLSTPSPDRLSRTDADGPPTRTAVQPSPDADRAPDGSPRRAAVRRPVRAMAPLEGPSDHELPTKIGPQPGAAATIDPMIRPRSDRRGLSQEMPAIPAPPPSDEDSEHEVPTYARPLGPAGQEALASRNAGSSRASNRAGSQRESSTGTDLAETARVIPRPPPSDPESETSTAIRPLASAPPPPFLASQPASVIVDEPSGVMLEEDDHDDESVTGLREPPPAPPRPARFGTESTFDGRDVAGPGPIVKGGTFSMNVSGQVPEQFPGVPPSGPEDDAPRTHVLSAAESLAAARVDPRSPHGRPDERAAAWGGGAGGHGGHVVQRGMTLGAGSSQPPAFHGSDAPPAAPTFGPPPPSFGPPPVPPGGSLEAQPFAPPASMRAPAPYQSFSGSFPGLMPPGGSGPPSQGGVMPYQHSVSMYPGMVDPASVQSGAWRNPQQAPTAAPPLRRTKLFVPVFIMVAVVATLVAYATYLLLR
ncbi:MAG: hypothetical protein HOW73_03075 [Polyangiaceae bacterium]|nr:hypothetical protein [Polyangiaceae bacterium]